MSDLQTVTVSILDKEYQIGCGPDEVAALKRSAQYLDDKMREVKSKSGLLGLDRIAVMAALNLANDYLGDNDKSSDVIKHQAIQIQGLSQKLDLALRRLKSKKQQA